MIWGVLFAVIATLVFNYHKFGSHICCIGDGYLLPVLAAVFVGGTPTWGGVGTVPGAAIGAFIVGFIETGVIAAGLTGYYTRFFYGLIIILSLIGHKLNQPRYR